LRISLPASRPYEFEARVRRVKRDTSFQEVRGRIGNTAVAGDFSVDQSKARPMLHADLRSKSADLADLGLLVGVGHSPDNAADRKGAARDEAGPARKDSSKRLFSDQTFDGEHLRTFDAHVTLDVGKLKAAELPELESVRVTADLDDGVLVMKPINIGLAGGHVVGLFTFDGRQKALTSHAKVDFQNMQIEKLLGRLPKGAESTGQIEGHFDLKGRGDSVAKILASSSGSMAVSMAGGGISNLLDAKLGLNRGKILRLSITGDRAIGIHSAVVAFDFEKGLGKSKTILLDTDQTRTEGAGIINLRDETVDVLLTPHPKKPGLFSMNSNIRVHGPIRQPEFSVEAREDEEQRK
jgi:uncharacterized protein involved in outer membrane biogenesis